MHAEVLSTEWLTPLLVRLVLTGGDLDSFEMPEATDAYINLAIPPPDAPYGPVFDPVAVKDTHPKETWPARRRYTVRSWDPAEQQLTVDFVVHGAEGPAGSWAASAQPGTPLVFTGPSGGYRPEPDAAWHLLVGDESAVPAIAASLDALPAGSRAVVRLVCDGTEHEVPLPSAAEVDLRWLHRTGEPGDALLLLGAVRSASFPDGRPDAFVHGEADEIRSLRRHLLVDRGLTRQHMSCSPYWRRTMTDEAWREIKRDYVAAMEAEVA